MEAHKIERINDPYLYPVDAELGYGGAFVTNFNIVEYRRYSIFSNNRLEFEQSEITGKIRHGGWRYQLGVALDLGEHNAIAVGKDHYSYHIFEGERERHFPTRDGYYISLVVYKK